MKKKTNIHIRYDSDADVLSMETSKTAPIEYAREMGNVVVHFTKRNQPVLLEVLEASTLLHKPGTRSFFRAARTVKDAVK